MQAFHVNRPPPAARRRRLAEDPSGALAGGWGLALPEARVEAVLEDGAAVKFRSRLEDGAAIESVLLPIRDRVSLCVSSQAGCRMGCAFCATGRGGYRRDLTAGEILWQAVAARRLGRTVDNVVFMGMGEPLDNAAAVIAAIRVLGDAGGFDIPFRRITVSTAGHADGLRELAACAFPNLRLAVSLNAAEDGLRDRLMPLNRRYPLARLREALAAFPLPRQGALFVEYVLLAGVNDSPAQADQAARWLSGLRVRVNLIPYNGGGGPRFETPAPERVQAFRARLAEHGLFVRVRTPRGGGVGAACGELAAG